MKSSDIAKALFSTTKFREGYSVTDVDDFLEKIQGSLAAWESGKIGSLTAADVEATRFPLTKFRAGYDEGEVDVFLDEAAAALASFEKQ